MKPICFYHKADIASLGRISMGAQHTAFTSAFKDIKEQLVEKLLMDVLSESSGELADFCKNRRAL